MQLAPWSPKQRDSILDSHRRLNIWHGAVRSGKTVASLFRWAHAVETWKGDGHLVMVGKTSRSLERNALDPLREMLGTRSVEVNRGAGEATILGRSVLIYGANDERAEQKIRGGTWGQLYGDEVTLWPESFFRIGMQRLSPPGAMAFLTTNPDNPLHWLKVDYLDKRGELDLIDFHFTLNDNNALTEAYKAALKAENTGLWRKRFVDGLWVSAAGAIWDGFDPDVHVVDSIPSDVVISRWLASFDYGTSNPFVALLVGVDTSGCYWVSDEWRWDSQKERRQLTDAQYRAKLEEWLSEAPGRPERIWGDPSATSFHAECRQHDLPVGPADNAVDDGLRTVATKFAQGQLRILSSCAGLISEIPGYVWDQKAQLKGIDQPLKVKDHGCDALRYAIRSDSTKRSNLSDWGWS